MTQLLPFPLDDPTLRPSREDRDRGEGRTPRALFTRGAHHVTADAANLPTWLTTATQQWAAVAGPMISQGAVTLVEAWGAADVGKPLLPVVAGTFALLAQPAQKDEVASSSPTIAANTDPPVALAGYVNVARQVIDFNGANADLIWALMDVASSAAFDAWICDTVSVKAQSAPDLASAYAMFDPKGLFSPTTLAASPAWFAAHTADAWTSHVIGMRIVADHRLTGALLLDPLAAVIATSVPQRDAVSEPAVAGMQLATFRYVSAGISPAGCVRITG